VSWIIGVVVFLLSVSSAEPVVFFAYPLGIESCPAEFVMLRGI